LALQQLSSLQNTLQQLRACIKINS
jgi:hypothetical protein